MTDNVSDSATLTLKMPELNKTLSFQIKKTDAAAKRSGWAKINYTGLNLTPALFDNYTKAPILCPFTGEIPGPGFYKIPTLSCTINGKACSIGGIAYRTQVDWRWPMYYPKTPDCPTGKETFFPGFSEDPDHLLVNFSW